MCTAELCVCVCVKWLWIWSCCTVIIHIIDIIWYHIIYIYEYKKCEHGSKYNKIFYVRFLYTLSSRIYEYIFYNTNSVIYLCTSIFYFSPLFTIILLSKIIWNPIYASAKCTITFKITESNGRMSFASIVNIMFLPLLHHFYSSFLSYF